MKLKPNVLDKVVLLLVSGMSGEALAEACGKLGIGPADVANAEAEARKRITVAANYDLAEQIGTAVTRLNDLYSRSIIGQDNRTALSSQREINKLLGLYRDQDRDDAGDGSSEWQARLNLIGSYLLPLKLTDAKYPIEEHARLAATALMKNGSHG